MSTGQSNKSLIILIALLILAGITMIIMQTNYSGTKRELTATIDTVSAARDKALLDYNMALERIEQLEKMNDSLKKRIGYNSALLASLKKKIADLMATGGPMGQQLTEAKNLIDQLNAKIAQYMQEIAQLRAQNEGLTKDKQILTVANKDLQIRVDTLRETNVVLKQKVDMASILVTGDVALVGVKVSGGEESESQKVNKMSLLRLKFNVLENRIIESGNYDFYATIQDPNGVTLTEGSAPIKITLADGSEVQATAKMTTEISQGQKRFVKYDYRSSSKFITGVYTVTIYQRGYKVGAGTGEFRKGFLGIF